MKMSMAFILSFIVLAGFYSNNQTVNFSQNRNDLVDLQEVAVKNNVGITSWMAFSRSKIGRAVDYHDMIAQIEEVMTEKEDYEWRLILEEKDHQYVWLGVKTNSLGITENLKLKAYTFGSWYEMAVTHEAKGKELDPQRISWISQTFDHESQTFYSVTGTLASNKAIKNIADQFVLDVKGEAIEQLNEKEFVSVSAYSEYFNSELLTKGNEKINMQIGLRKHIGTNEIDVTIGTPIITTEY